MGKFIMTTGKDGQFYWSLKAGNGEIIGQSEGYTTKSAAMNGIESTRKNAMSESNFELKEAKNGKFHWNLKASNGQIIMSSQMYATQASAKNGMESVMKNAPQADMADETASTQAA